MTLEQLEVLAAIVEKGSFRAAAEYLNKSQPALSFSIKMLEEEFNIQIFDRSKYRPQLTKLGEIFLNSAYETLDAAKLTAKLANELSQTTTETEIRIAIDPLVSISTLDKISNTCRKHSLPTNIIVEKNILDSSTQSLLDGKIDLAISVEPKNKEHTELIEIETIRLVGTIAKTKLPKAKKLNISILNQVSQILTYDKQIKSTVGNDDRKNHQKIFVPDHFMKVKLIEEGIGWGRLSEKEIQVNKSLHVIDKSIVKPIELKLCLIRSKYNPAGPVAQSIWKLFERT